MKIIPDACAFGALLDSFFSVLLMLASCPGGADAIKSRYAMWTQFTIGAYKSLLRIFHHTATPSLFALGKIAGPLCHPADRKPRPGVNPDVLKYR